MTSERDVADFLRVSLIGNLVSVSEVIAWTDQVILTSSDLSNTIIELSLSSKARKNKIIQLLKDVAWELGKSENAAVIIEFTLALIKQRLSQGSITYDQATHVMDLLSQKLHVPKKYYDLYSIRDYYELAEMGHVHSLQQVKDNVDSLIASCELPEDMSFT